MKKRYTSDPNQASRRNAFTKQFNKIFLALFVFLLWGVNLAWGQNWTPDGSTDGTYYIKSTGIGNNFEVATSEGGPYSGDYSNFNGIDVQSGHTINIFFKTEHPVQVNAQIKVTQGILNMSLGSGYSSDVTLLMNWLGTTYQGHIFITNSTNTLATAKQVNISGNNSKQFVIDGGCPDLQRNYDSGKDHYYITCSDNSKKSNSPLLRAGCGTIDLQYVTLQNNWSVGGEPSVGGLLINGAQDGSNLVVNMTNCTVTKCAAHHYPGVGIQFGKNYEGAGTKPKITLTDCTFTECYSTTTSTTVEGVSLGAVPVSGGCWVNNNASVRSVSTSYCDLEMQNCTITNNYGGGIRWQSVGADAAVINNCTITNNWNPGNGGGLHIKAAANITNCTIQYNNAKKDGGGIFFSTFEESGGDVLYDQMKPKDAMVTLDASTKINNNTAGVNGGGIAIFAKLIHPKTKYYYFSFDNVGNETTNQLKVGVSVEGAQIKDNTASTGDGGGIYISRSANATFYKTTALLKYGLIQGNTAGADGGGVAIVGTDTYSNPASMPAIIVPQDITVEIGKGASEDMKIQGNQAKNGGGVYVDANEITYNGVTSGVFTTLFEHAKVQKGDAATGNTALLSGPDTGNGGGIYVKKGTVTINNGIVDNNIAQAAGGGIYVYNGIITTAAEPEAEPLPGGGSGTPLSYIIPDDYQELEYIQNDNSISNYGYIDTEIPANAGHSTWAKVAKNDKDYNLFPVYAYSNNSNRFGCRFYNLSGHVVWRVNNIGENNHRNFSGATYNTSEFEVAQNHTALTVTQSGSTQSYTYPTPGPGSGSIGANWYLLGHSRSIGNDYVSRGKLYQAKIWSSIIQTDENLIGWYIPVKEKAGSMRVGVYNVITSSFIPATGTMHAGPVVIGSKGGATASTGGASATSTSPATAGGSRTAISGCTVTNNVAATDGGGIYLGTGNIFLTNAIISNNKATTGNGGGVYNNNGKIFVNYWDATDPNNGTSFTVRGETIPSTISGNTAGGNGGGLNTHSGKIYMRGQAPTQDIVISGNKAGFPTSTGSDWGGSGGGIFCLGDASVEFIRLINVNLTDNEAHGAGTVNTVAAGCGGGMYLQRGTINITKCELQRNSADVNGGAINNHNGKINVMGCIIGGSDSDGNSAGNNGGGIYTTGIAGVTDEGDIDIENYQDGLSVYHRSEITYNTAGGNGGGINTHEGTITVTGVDEVGKRILVTHNTATNGSGGGVFCMGNSSTPDVEHIIFRNVDLNNNNAQYGNGTTGAGGVTTGCGGGLYLQYGIINVTNVQMQNNAANWNGGAINNHHGNINVAGCPIQNNNAGHSGGGIYTNSGNIDLQDHIVHGEGSLTHVETTVSNNHAIQNGGGINTHAGTITINFDPSTGRERETDHQIEITNNTANKGGGIYANAGIIIAANALIDHNEATENGGGVNNHAGDISFYGGSLSNNTAVNGKGGGAFTYVGDIRIFPFPVDAASPSLNNGTKVYNNKANLNGGGVNNHTGRVDLRYATIRNNTSTLGNGGGIFCEGPHSNETGYTIRMFNSQLMHNKTRGQDGTPAEPTGRGGGIYLKYGSIFARNSQIHENFANINGGGLDNHDGVILVYGCDITNNRAVTGRGGGIYTEHGTITTGPSLLSGSSQSSLIQNNTAQINGGGINNHQGDIFLNGDRILNNTAVEGNGGGIYIANGQIDMYGGEIANNTAGQDGGGVYSGGGEFNIEKRQGNPIVEIIEVEVFRSGDPKVHYHLVDQGSGTLGDPVNSTPAFTSPQEHGIIWGTSESIVTNATLADLGGATQIPCTYADMTEPSCYRIPIDASSLSASTIYYTKAYAINSDSKIDYSDVVAFTTFGSAPTVLTGDISNFVPVAAKYAAEANAKVIDSGSYRIAQRGFCYAATKKLPTLSDDSHVEETPLSSAEFYTCNLSNLEPNTTYWIRAYVKNTKSPTPEIGYGDTVRFTTPKLVPNLNGNVVSIGDGTSGTTAITANSAQFTFTLPAQTLGVKAYGFVWSSDDDPTLEEDNSHHWILDPASTEGRTFTFTPDNLEPGTHYYVRAFATFEDYDNGADPGQYALSTPVDFYTLGEGGKPVVIFKAFSGVTRTSATITGELKSKYTAITKYGICYSTTTTLPTNHGIDCEHVEFSGDLNVNVPFDINLPGSNPALIPNTTYYLRVYATSSTDATPLEVDIAYSNVFSFTTLPVVPPTVEVEVINIERTTATVKCIVDDGGQTLTGSYGIYCAADDGSGTGPASWGSLITSSNYGTAPNPANVYTVDLTSLTASTKYWVKAEASNGDGTNGTGTFTGRPIAFTTSYDKPTFPDPNNEAPVTLVSVDYDPSKFGGLEEHLMHTITVKGKVTGMGDGASLTKFGFVYSIYDNPTLDNLSSEWDCGYVEVTPPAAINTLSDNAVLSQKVNANRLYYIRAYASTKASPTSADYSYSDAIQVMSLPTVRRVEHTPTNNTAALIAKIHNSDEFYRLRKYGFVWSKESENATPEIGGSSVYTSGDQNIYEGTADPRTIIWNATSLVPGTTYVWRAYVKNTDNLNDPARGIAYTSVGQFTTYNYALTVASNPAAGGNVSVDGTLYMDNGNTRTVTATPSTGYVFDEWTVSGTGASVLSPTNASTTFTMGTADATLTANFNATVTVQASPMAGGSVTGGGDYPINATPTLTATANTGYDFVNWTNENGDIVSSTASFDYTVTGPATLTANFTARGGRGDASGASTGSGSGSATSASPRPRDIYPAPAREPWDWDEDEWVETVCTPSLHEDDTLTQPIDTLTEPGERATRTTPVDIPLIQHNTAERGGGIFIAKNISSPARLVFSGGSNDTEIGKIILNYASEAGGGIYIDTTAYMQMKGYCEVNGNHVPNGKDGGGIYQAGRLYVGNPGSGASENALKVNQNFAMTDFNETDYLANPNSYSDANKALLNNALLARHKYDWTHVTDPQYDDEAAVLVLLSDIAGTGANSKVGFHVKQGFCPVVATADAFGGDFVLANEEGTLNEKEKESWLQQIMNTAISGTGTFLSTGSIFEDTESYVAIHTRKPGEPFHSKYIYLWGCWTHPVVMNDPETGSPMSGGSDFKGHYKITNSENTGANSTIPSGELSNKKVLEWEIYSEEGLAWFTAYVNGLNVFSRGDVHTPSGTDTIHRIYDPNINPKAKAKLMNDLDLSAYYWVPIGSVTQFNNSNLGSNSDLFTDNNDHHFKGQFDGQGHTITGIDCRYITGIHKLGLFGYLDESAVVKNVFIDDSQIETTSSDVTFHVGGLAGLQEGSAVVSGCEARAKINVTTAKSDSYVGGLVGQVTGTSTIHSSMAMPEITGAVDNMGGLVGELGSGNFLYNSFSNPKFNTAPAASKYIGGLVGVNNGIVENCYARLQNATDPERFGYLAGTSNNADIKYCYIPSGKSNYVGTGTVPTGHGTYTATQRFSGKYGFKHRDQQMTAVTPADATYISEALNDVLIVGGLTNSLNAWVTAKGSTTYHPWIRTMASGINDDLPILNFRKESAKALSTDPLYNAVGSKDGMYMDYALDVNDLLTDYAALSSGTPEIYLYDANTQSDGTTHQDITVTNIGTTPEVKLYIHEDVGIKVSGDASSTGLKARVGVTINNSRADENDPNWHLFSSAIENAPIGLEYHTDDATSLDYSAVSYGTGTYANLIVNNGSHPQHLDDVYGVRQYFDPPKTTWRTTPGSIGYFPTNTPYGRWRSNTADPLGFFDLYDYSEENYHWINYKREGSASYMDHWHMDPEHGSMLHWKINYMNKTAMAAGKGWLMALSSQSMMMADGTLNTGNKTINVTRTADYANTPPNGSYGTYTSISIAEWRSLNLVGNPYQSYLNFTALYDGNSSTIHETYGVREDNAKTYLYYTKDDSQPYDAYPNIHPHQGFFVKVKEGVGIYNLNFTDAMRVAGTPSTVNSAYRDQMNYPLVALNCYDAQGYYDRIRVELNRPELGGGEKMSSLRSGNALIYSRFEGQDWQTLFTPEGVSEVPVRFEAFEDGIYTMKWETYNGNFSYMHLIDNLAGKDIDCLAAEEYQFEGKTSDYKSRFKLVFQCTGVDENTDDEATNVSFAFQHEDELIVNGEGFLQLFDVTGRCLMTADVHGEQSSLILPPIATGVYLLRLSGTQVKVQKIIIQ